MHRIYRQELSSTGRTVLYSNERVRGQGDPIIKVWMPRPREMTSEQMPKAMNIELVADGVTIIKEGSL